MAKTANADKAAELEARAKELDEKAKALKKQAEDLAALEKSLKKRAEELDGKEAVLKKAGEDIQKAEKALADKEKALNDLDAELKERAATMGGAAIVGTEEEALSEADAALIEKAMNVYCIGPEDVFSSGIDGNGKAVIVTNGGARVRYAYGDEKREDFAETMLTEVQITGINPNPKKRKPLVGKA